jgi:hypothetical protein
VATSNVGTSEEDESYVTSILGCFASCDASIDAAAKSAGIPKIRHMDYKAKSIPGLYEGN